MMFTIIGRPQPKQRPRFSKGHTYTPKKTVDYEKYVRECYITSGGKTLLGALKCRIEVFYSLPKSKLKLGYDIPCMKRPDIDNIIKIIFDSLNGVAYDDDSQIVELIATKKYGEVDMVVVGLEKINETSMD